MVEMCLNSPGKRRLKGSLQDFFDEKVNRTLEFRRVELTTTDVKEDLHSVCVPQNEWRGLEEFNGGISPSSRRLF